MASILCIILKERMQWKRLPNFQLSGGLGTTRARAPGPPHHLPGSLPRTDQRRQVGEDGRTEDTDTQTHTHARAPDEHLLARGPDSCCRSVRGARAGPGKPRLRRAVFIALGRVGPGPRAELPMPAGAKGLSASRAERREGAPSGAGGQGASERSSSCSCGRWSRRCLRCPGLGGAAAAGGRGVLLAARAPPPARPAVLPGSRLAQAAAAPQHRWLLLRALPERPSQPRLCSAPCWAAAGAGGQGPSLRSPQRALLPPLPPLAAPAAGPAWATSAWLQRQLTAEFENASRPIHLASHTLGPPTPTATETSRKKFKPHGKRMR
uniref:Uncharacterized protein LOC110213288 n=1 Tax=Phascolarctos cinereus TaxID=38626 RepID=A0A6P5L0U7_PHACI|nr:uncharacterized protein LOC110213288 [Phascolarctos cinereus]